MIYTKLTNEAMRMAYAAHHGQLDKGDVPYILHPVHLAEQMDDEYSTCVALLHDTIEDTDMTLEQLTEIFPKEVVDAVALLTHNDNEPYLHYVARIRSNPLAKKVKLADLHHNSDESRTPDADNATKIRWKQKYEPALRILEEA